MFVDEELKVLNESESLLTFLWHDNAEGLSMVGRSCRVLVTFCEELDPIHRPSCILLGELESRITLGD